MKETPHIPAPVEFLSAAFSLLSQSLLCHFQCTFLCAVSPNEATGMYKDAARDPADPGKLLITQTPPLLQKRQSRE